MLTRQVKVAKFEALQEADQIVPRLFGRGSASSLKRGSVLQLIPACAGMTGGGRNGSHGFYHPIRQRLRPNLRPSAFLALFLSAAKMLLPRRFAFFQ